ncbi:hypothetical protein B7L70_03580 [Vulcanisaeta sp. EB80]|uniref:PD-(D/E)XK nuclease family protein n=1 Tax=Vulcanisaeta sp. EB80 TaxID=1650660 RepID=UPI0009BCB59E|nr:DUF3782 domain-containing protein [Vulcanisaeta sp. EB80]PLC68377.1 hypothetical protein B7L70_03580 [Vulcanisaeta sp. EB80]
MGANLRVELLRLLREDEEFRLAVMGLIGYADLKSSVDRLVEAVNELTKLAKAHEERLARLESAVEELTRAIKAHEERLAKVEDRLSRVEAAIEELTRAVKAHDERLTRLEGAVEELTKAVKAHEDRLTRVEDRLTRLENAVEELTKAVRSHEDRLARVEDAIKAFDRRLMALGARWGVESEEAFRNAMRGVVEGILGVATVGKWVYFDKDGMVYGHPSQVEVDVAIRDGTHILIEIKASASSGDALEFSRVGKLYETITGIKPRLVLVTPFIDDRGLEAARTLGIEVYTSV